MATNQTLTWFNQQPLIIKVMVVMVAGEVVSRVMDRTLGPRR